MKKNILFVPVFSLILLLLNCCGFGFALEYEKAYNTMCMLAIVTLIILLILIAVIAYHKKKQVALKLYLYELECELRNKQLELEKKKELLLSNFKQRIEFSLQFNQIKQNSTNISENNDLLAIITDHVVLKESEWSYHIEEADKIFEGKLSVLQNNFPDLTMQDMIVIVLICLDISVPNSCNLLNMSKNTLYTRRKRIKKRLEIDSKLNIVGWLQDFVAPDNYNEQ